MRSAVIVFVTVLATVACTHPAGEPTPTMASSSIEPVAQSTGKVIATLVTHDAKVSILSGERVIVRKIDGTIVADGIRIDELRAIDPLLDVLVRNAVASNGGGTYIDATLSLPQNHAHH